MLKMVKVILMIQDAYQIKITDSPRNLYKKKE